jgi:NitT/TauT family transport system permease protein
MKHIVNSFLPNRTVPANTLRFVAVLEVLLSLISWILAPFTLMPTPKDVVVALGDIWQSGLMQELLTSLTLNLQAVGIATAISLILAYLTVIPAFRPVVAALSWLRFLSMAGLTVMFTVMIGGGHALRVVLLSYAISVFFVGSMADVIAHIPKEQYDLARTLRMSDWGIVWEVVIRGQMDAAFDVLRQNAAIGWMMLTMVEGMARSGGGIGTMLLNEQKQFNLAAIMAIQLIVALTGGLQDYLIGTLKNIACPYARLRLER